MSFFIKILSSCIKVVFITLFTLLVNNAFSQAIINDGAKIIAGSGVSVLITDGNGGADGNNFINQNSGANYGKVSLNGKIYIDGNWTNNASDSVFYDNNTGTVIFNGASPLSIAQSVGGSNITSFYNLTVNNSSVGIVIDKNIIVKNILLMDDGDIDLKNDTIDLVKTGTITGETEANRIKAGNTGINTGIIKTTKTISNVTDYNPANLGLEITTNQNLGTITIVRGHQRQQGSGSFTSNYSIDRYFDVPGIGEIDGSNVNVKLKYWDAELQGYTEANLVQYQSVTQSSNTWWSPLTGTVDVATNLYTPANNPYTSYIYGAAYPDIIFNNRFTLSSTDVPLPIELINFTAECNTDKVNIQWSTASEINNDYFTVEKSIDLLNWEPVITIPGAGNSNSLLSYNTTDENPYPEISYYRLEQTDYDGTSNYLDIASVHCNNNQGFDIISINIDPNNNLLITFQSEENQIYNVNLYDVTGRKLITETTKPTTGMNTLQLNITDISRGIYLLTFDNNIKIWTKKILLH